MAGAGEALPTLLPNRVQPGNSVLQQAPGTGLRRGPRKERAGGRLQGTGRGAEVVDQGGKLLAAGAARRPLGGSWGDGGHGA